jgi:hypothetical protein
MTTTHPFIITPTAYDLGIPCGIILPSSNNLVSSHLVRRRGGTSGPSSNYELPSFIKASDEAQQSLSYQLSTRTYVPLFSMVFFVFSFLALAQERHGVNLICFPPSGPSHLLLFFECFGSSSHLVPSLFSPGIYVIFSHIIHFGRWSVILS